MKKSNYKSASPFSGLSSVMVVLIAALCLSGFAEAGVPNPDVSGKTVLDVTALTVLIASVINAVVPAKYQSFVGPIIKVLSLAFWSGKNREN